MIVAVTHEVNGIDILFGCLQNLMIRHPEIVPILDSRFLMFVVGLDNQLRLIRNLEQFPSEREAVKAFLRGDLSQAEKRRDVLTGSLETIAPVVQAIRDLIERNLS